MNFRSEGKTLQVERPDGWHSLYECPAKIMHAYSFPIGFVIVIACSDRNVLLVDHGGALVWRIGEATTTTLAGNDMVKTVADPFTYLDWKDGRLTAQTQAGFRYEVNNATGELTPTGWIKN